MRVSLILNVHSSQTQRHVAEIPSLFAARGVVVDDVAEVESEADLRARTKRALKKGARLVVVGGGDGSLTTAVDVLAHSEAALGVLPLGTGNSFAQTLGIPDDLASAVDVIAAQRIVRVDLGRVNGVHFANFATIGLSAEIAAATPRALKRAIGPAAYVAAGAAALFRHPPFDAKVRWDDGRSLLNTRQIVVANGRFFGHQPVTPDASIVNRRLAFFTTTGVSHLEVARMYAAFGIGAQTRLPDAVFFSAKEIVVKAKPKQLVSIDGQSLGRTPARFSIAARALQVCVPADFDDARR